MSAIGTGGGHLYYSADITHMDKDRNLTRISARGGLGAVMGAKKLVFDRPRANRPDVIDKDLWGPKNQSNPP